MIYYIIYLCNLLLIYSIIYYIIYYIICYNLLYQSKLWLNSYCICSSIGGFDDEVHLFQINLQYNTCIILTSHLFAASYLLLQSLDWKYSHANWKNTKWSLTCFKNILKYLHSNYLQFCCNLNVEFAIFLKISLVFNSFYCLFCLLTKPYSSIT